MEKGTVRGDEFAAAYKAALQSYLRRGGEAGLQRAYELGRQCLAEGAGVLSMVALHHAAIEEIFSSAKGSKRINGDTLSKAGIFFAQTMSPFEITHRAVGEANDALRHMNETLEEEVKRIAHALHSEAGQLLAAVHLSLDRVERELNLPAASQFQEVKDLLDGVDQQIRRLSHELRPTLLDDLGLVPAIEFLSAGVAKRSGLQIRFRHLNVKRLPAALETVLYRVVQEALNNVTKHARAKAVRIQLSSSNNIVLCTVADDGVGFDPRAFKTGTRERGLGLIGIREKLQPLGGTVRLISSPGRGTKLVITVPQAA